MPCEICQRKVNVNGEFESSTSGKVVTGGILFGFLALTLYALNRD